MRYTVQRPPPSPAFDADADKSSRSSSIQTAAAAISAQGSSPSSCPGSLADSQTSIGRQSSSTDEQSNLLQVTSPSLDEERSSSPPHDRVSKQWRCGLKGRYIRLLRTVDKLQLNIPRTKLLKQQKQKS